MVARTYVSTEKEKRRKFRGMKLAAAGSVVAAGMLAANATAASAVYPPVPQSDVSQSATTVQDGGSVNFVFGNPIGLHYLPGTSVQVACTSTEGKAGPATALAADAEGLAKVSFVFTNPGTYTCVATGQGNNGTQLSLSAQPVTVLSPSPSDGGGGATVAPVSGGGSGSGGGSATTTGQNTTGTLSQTGGGNTVNIALIGGGILLAGLGLIFVARRREHEE